MTFDELVTYTLTVILAVGFCIGVILVILARLRREPCDCDVICDAPEPSPVVLVRTRAPLSPEETKKIAEAWFLEDGPTLHLVEDALDHFLADAVAGVCREDVTPDQRAFAAASLDTTRRFRAYLFSLHEDEPAARGFKKVSGDDQ